MKNPINAKNPLWPVLALLLMMAGCGAPRKAPEARPISGPSAKREQDRRAIALTTPVAVRFSIRFTPDPYQQTSSQYAIVKGVHVDAPAEMETADNELFLLLDGVKPLPLSSISEARFAATPGKAIEMLVAGRKIEAQVANLVLCRAHETEVNASRCFPVKQAIGAQVCIACQRPAFDQDRNRRELLTTTSAAFVAGLGFADHLKAPDGTFTGTYVLLNARERSEMERRLPAIYAEEDARHEARTDGEKRTLEAARKKSKAQDLQAMRTIAARLPLLPVGATDNCVATALFPTSVAYGDGAKFDCGRLGAAVPLGALHDAGWEVRQESRKTVYRPDGVFDYFDLITITVRKVRK